ARARSGPCSGTSSALAAGDDDVLSPFGVGMIGSARANSSISHSDRARITPDDRVMEAVEKATGS
ncbi:MAG TPA: hypothetical protein VFA59_15405, partial [Vicinamibacterales bacterium]|nr:hypothetical protein [Vicinamibacterales bacterium]